MSGIVSNTINVIPFTLLQTLLLAILPSAASCGNNACDVVFVASELFKQRIHT
jgi:hypothetical protein